MVCSLLWAVYLHTIQQGSTKEGRGPLTDQRGWGRGTHITETTIQGEITTILSQSFYIVH